jgi:hypothetical protein
MCKLILAHIDRDSWQRPIYERGDRLYVDVDPRKDRNPYICTKNNNAFDGEPLDPIPEGTAVEIIPCRDTW